MRKFKVRYQKTHIVLNQMTIEVVEEVISADLIDLEDEWLIFENHSRDPKHPAAIIVKAFMRMTVFSVEEIIEEKN